MMRLFNQREGVAEEADRLPAKVFEPLRGGPSDGAAVDREEFDAARRRYYAMAGWDDTGRVTRAKLVELDLAHLADDPAAPS
jgi:aldehyde:ferredoxin oxidoreductase